MTEGRGFEFKCSSCGELHYGSPSFAYDMPLSMFGVSEEDVGKRVHLTSDTCSIDDAQFFIRATLEIPIDGAKDPFSWGVWVSQSEESYRRYLETYDDDQTGIATFGWLTVFLPGYQRTAPGEPLENLACDVEWQPEGLRPLVVPHESDHPLFLDYRQGISWRRAIEIAELVMHQ